MSALCPVTRSPVARSPVTRSPVTRSPVARGPLARRQLPRRRPGGGGSLALARIAMALIGVMLAAVAGSATPARALEYQEAPSLATLVSQGQLPPLSERLPQDPLMVTLEEEQTIGRYGGRLRMLMADQKDTKLMVVYGYARLVRRGTDLELHPDILRDVEVQEGRIFTLHLRRGHKWSDGHPFTTEDFRYYWEDIKLHTELSPAGPPQEMLVNGQPPRVEILDEVTIRYSWDAPNPQFLPAMARTVPLEIFAPAHYLKPMHAQYGDVAALEAQASARGLTSWAALHNDMNRSYRNNNPDLPSLQPWVLAEDTATQSRFVRNPYFHRIDPEGRQLPYLDEWVFTLTETRMVPLRTATGQSDLQARYLTFEDIRALKVAEAREPFQLRVWYDGRGSNRALYPNLNASDPMWRGLMQDARFRRALSLGVDRERLNKVLFYGVGAPADNLLLPDSPLMHDEALSPWARHDPAAANALLDEIGLTARGPDGLRLLPNGEPLEIIVGSAGQDVEETDTLALIKEQWAEIGVGLLPRPSQLEVFRNRVFSGDIVLSISNGLENGLAGPDTEPLEFAPTRQQQLHWPIWGLHTESQGAAGTPPDQPAAMRLLELWRSWFQARTEDEQTALWQEILALHEDQVFTIGLVAKVPQIVVVHQDLRNLPETGLYNWEPGAHFGIHGMDLVYWAEPQ